MSDRNIQPSSRLRFKPLELIGASCLNLGHDLANDLTVLSAMKYSLDKVRTSGDVSSVEHMLNGLQKTLDSLTTTVRTINLLRGDLVANQRDFTAGEFIHGILKPSLASGWSLEVKHLCDGIIHSDPDLLCASLHEIAFGLASSGRLEVSVAQGRVDILELGLPLHLASEKFLRLNFFPVNAEPSNGSEVNPLPGARLRAASAVLKSQGCIYKAITTGGPTSTVLIPIKDKNAS
jgi:hypothetical protein